MKPKAMGRERLKGHLDLLLLALFLDGPAHGYEIVMALKERSDGTFDLPEGTVYPALHRLESGGALRSSWNVAAGRRRRTYELTAAGRKTLQGERDAWSRFAFGVNAVLAVGT
jgi:PadR family transcriptional regulator PadR